MKDKELRAQILKLLYDNRHLHAAALNASHFEGVKEQDLLRVILQLSEYGMVQYLGNAEEGYYVSLKASGVDAVENEGVGAPVELMFPVTQHINISNSSNFQIGNHNTQTIIQGIESILEQVDKSNATPAEKAEVKSRIARLLEHPLTAAIVGGATQGLIGLATGSPGS